MKRMLKMEVFLKVVAVFTFSTTILVSAEEPFCNNKCHNIGVATSRICNCDDLCATVYNDCCGDSKYLVNPCKQSSMKKRNKMFCSKLYGSDAAAYMVNECSSVWKGPEMVRNSCKDQSNSSVDPIMGVPVTNAVTGITYRNYHCAICNGGMKSGSFWQIKLVCPTISANLMELDRQEVSQYIFYNKTTGTWGFSVRDSNKNGGSFHACHIRYVLPRTLKDKVRRCDPDLVSECSPTWNDDAIQLMCQSYVDTVYSKDGATKYRNLYCAICNRVDMSQLSCGMAISRQHEGVPRVDDRGVSFPDLLDIDTRDGNIVGEKQSGITCTKEEVFDPFAKKCRSIVCALPGYTLKDNKCVKS